MFFDPILWFFGALVKGASSVCTPNHWWLLRSDEHFWTLHNLEFFPTHCLTWKVPTWSLQHPTPTHREMKKGYLRLSHQHVTVEWIVPKDGCLWFRYFHWPPCPQDLQIAFDRASQVQDIALVVVVVGVGGASVADNVWKKKLSCCRCYQLQGTPSLYGQYWGQEQQQQGDKESPMTEEKEHGQKFESHHILGYGNHLPNHQGTNFDLKKKKAAWIFLI